MQIRLLQAQAVKVNGDEEGKLREKQGIGVINLSWKIAFILISLWKQWDTSMNLFVKPLVESLFYSFSALQLSTVPWRMVIVLET